ncbi:MAG TPA: CHAD domain-containing protein, partial [Vicinamibacteria bacterium]|nr:CHAD domain-containing protein [Vicinamibacteria bacterium]
MTPPTGDRVTPLLRQRIKAVFRRLPRALAGGEEDLRQMRVAGRRLRVALPLLGRKPAGKRVRRSLRLLRGMTRTGGISRDLDVSVALLDEEIARSGITAQRRVLQRRLKAARARGRSRMAEALLDLEIARLRRDLRLLARQGDGFFAVLRRLRETREREGAETLALLTALGDRFDPVELHRLRRCVRRLRYAAELSGALKGQMPSGAEFRALQNELGALHDTHVLAGWLESQARAGAARGESAVSETAAALQAVFLTASQAHHRAFLAASPEELIARALAGMGQSTVGVGRAAAAGGRGYSKEGRPCV